MPVGTSSAAPGTSSSGAPMQARKSMPAEPAVACCGSGNSRPMRGSRIRSLTVRRMPSAPRAPGAHSIAREGGDPAFARTAPWAAVGRRQALSDQGNELARNFNFGSARDLDLAAGPNDGERVVVAIERNPLADLVGGNHVELLALELDARVLLDVVGLGREPDHVRTLRHIRDRLDDVGRGLAVESDRHALLFDLLLGDG